MKCDFGKNGCNDKEVWEILLLSFPNSHCNLSLVIFSLTIIVHTDIVNSLNVQMVNELLSGKICMLGMYY
jgi:hypothetical protein